MKAHEALKHWGIALTGGIACGKSTVAAILRQHGYTVLDADAISRDVVAAGTEGLAAVAQTFGADLLLPDGTMNRARMRELIFSDSGKRLQLEAIIHPRLTAEVQKALDAKGFAHKPQYWFYEAALIYERRRAADFKEVWVAYCPEDIQIERLMQRDASTRALAESILAAQMPARQKADQADRVIDTNCSLEELQARVLTALTPLRGSP